MKKYLIWFIYLIILSSHTHAQVYDLKSEAERNINLYFSTYTSKDIASTQHSSYFKGITIDNKNQIVTVLVDGSFAQQELNDKLIGKDNLG